MASLFDHATSAVKMEATTGVDTTSSCREQHEHEKDHHHSLGDEDDEDEDVDIQFSIPQGSSVSSSSVATPTRKNVAFSALTDGNVEAYSNNAGLYSIDNFNNNENDNNNNDYSNRSSSVRSRSNGRRKSWGIGGHKSRRGLRLVNEEEEGDDDDIYNNEEDEYELEEDAYNIFFVSKIFSPGQVVAITSMAVQCAILTMIGIDLLSHDSQPKGVENHNFYNIPLAVDRGVANSQLLALVVAMMTQENAIVSIDALFLADYDPTFKLSYPSATLWKWRIANLLRWTIGVITLLASFLIVVQSDDILDIFMNFTAVEFVDSLDNVAFQLAAGGYLGGRLQEDTRAVRSIKFQRDRRPWRMLASRAAFVATLAMLVSGWLIFRIDQKNGRYLAAAACDKLYVKFGDEYTNVGGPLYYSSFSGRYHARFESDQRPVYYERSAENITPRTARFYYCDAEKSWHFTIPSLDQYIPDGTKKYCKEGWLLQSPVTSAYKLEDIGLEGWKMIGVEGTLTHNVKFTLRCSACSRDSDCSFNGRCIKGECNCYDQWRGFECNVQGPLCQALVRISYSETASHYQELGVYDLLRDENGKAIEIYGRPAYVLGSFGQDGCGTVVLYTGVRWFEMKQCEADLTRNFHAHWNAPSTWLQYTYSDASDGYQPFGHQWYVESPTLSMGTFGSYGANVQLVRNRYECRNVSCDNFLECGIQGTCIEDESGLHRCECSDYSGGHFCEYSKQSGYAINEFQEFNDFITGMGYPGNVTFEELDKAISLGTNTSELSVSFEYYQRYWRPNLAKDMNVSVTSP